MRRYVGKYVGTPRTPIVQIEIGASGRWIASGRRYLPLRLDLRRHSPSGFAWGYGGSGPAQLALALLADATDAATALEHYQAFKWLVISKLPEDEAWTLTAEEIKAELERVKCYELAFHCKNRALSAILREDWPIEAARCEELIAELQAHTGAEAHIAAGAFNDVLAEYAEQLERQAERVPSQMERALGEDR
jgi:hypothetical protein